jgi:hypothetical protein
MVIAIVPSGFDLIFHASQQHKGFRKLATFQIIGYYVRKAFVSPPHDIDVPGIFHRLRVHPVIVQHLQAAILGKGNRPGETSPPYVWRASAAMRKDDTRNQT